MPGTTSPEGSLNYLRLGETLGIDPAYTGSMTMGGGTAGALVQMAAMAIDAGLATHVACVFGDAAKTGGSRFSRASGATDSWGLWGMFAAAANPSTSASRHLAPSGTTSPPLREHARARRHPPSHNPAAGIRRPT